VLVPPFVFGPGQSKILPVDKTTPDERGNPLPAN